MSKKLIHRRGEFAIFHLNFLNHITENFRRATFLCFRRSLVPKQSCLREVIMIFHLETSYENTSVYRNKPGIEKIQAKYRGILLSLDTFLSHWTQKSRRCTLLCFIRFLVSKNFMDTMGVCHCFASQISLSHSTEKFRKYRRTRQILELAHKNRCFWCYKQQHEKNSETQKNVKI